MSPQGALRRIEPSSRTGDVARPSASGRETLLGRLPALAAEIATGAAARDRDRELPFEAFALFRQSGLGAIRVPVERGGPGGTIADLIEVIATLAAADSNVAHALRSHFNFTESLALSPPATGDDRQWARLLDGAIFGGAFTELGTAQPGTITTTLVRRGDSYRLNGRKYYATGTAFSDYASFGAIDESGTYVTALLPVTRAGIHILDDWDGMGQRLTASGGVDLVDVEVFDDEIAPRQLVGLVGRHTSALRQLHLVACAAGIIRNVVSDATAYVRRQARAALHSHVERAIDDPFVQQTIGEISAASYAIDTLIAANAAALDRSATAIQVGAPDAEAVVLDGALVTARTQITVAKLALKAAETMFEVGGGSATSRQLNFDRHWRNVRTLLNHNPLLHKARVVGDFYLNGTTDHLKEGRVF